MTLTVAPNAGYKLETITVTTVDDQSAEPNPSKAVQNIEVTKTGVFTYTFVMPASAVNVNAAFVLDQSTAIDGINLDNGQGRRYVNPMGQMSDRPFRGVNIVIDGDRTYKVVKWYKIGKLSNKKGDALNCSVTFAYLA